MSQCPRCRTPYREGQPFCAQCGQPLTQASFSQQTTPQMAPQPVAQKPNRTMFYIASGAVAILVALILFARLNLSAAAQTGSPDLKVAKKLEAAPLEKAATAPEQIVMPDEIREWLKHLERMENEKQNLTIKQMADMKIFEKMIGALGPSIGEMNPYDQTGDGGKSPEQFTKGKFEELKPAWQKLKADFEAVPPPAECKPLADAFGQGLNEIPAMVEDLNQVMNEMNTDPSKALSAVQGMKNRSYSTIDRAFQEADGQLSAICDKYKTAKWFNIKTDVVGGSLLSKPGM